MKRTARITAPCMHAAGHKLSSSTASGLQAAEGVNTGHTWAIGEGGGSSTTPRSGPGESSNRELRSPLWPFSHPRPHAARMPTTRSATGARARIKPRRANAFNVVEVVSRVAPIRLASSLCESGREYSRPFAEFDTKDRRQTAQVVQDAGLDIVQAQQRDLLLQILLSRCEQLRQMAPDLWLALRSRARN